MATWILNPNSEFSVLRMRRWGCGHCGWRAGSDRRGIQPQIHVTCWGWMTYNLFFPPKSPSTSHMAWWLIPGPASSLQPQPRHQTQQHVDSDHDDHNDGKFPGAVFYYYNTFIMLYLFLFLASTTTTLTTTTTTTATALTGTTTTPSSMRQNGDGAQDV